MRIDRDEFKKTESIQPTQTAPENPLANNFLANQNSTPFQKPNNFDAAEAFLFRKRLNAMDSSLIEETTYATIDDPNLKLENKIERIEEIISVLDEKIIVAETVKDDLKAKEMFIQKTLLEKKLKKLQDEYKAKGFDTRLTQGIISFFGLPENLAEDMKNNFERFLNKSQVGKHVQPVIKFFQIKDTLSRLDKINKSVDELVSMQVPFGENDARYETLAKHLARANHLHNQIHKELK